MSVAPVLKNKYRTRNAFRIGGSLPPLCRDSCPFIVSSDQPIVEDLAIISIKRNSPLGIQNEKLHESMGNLMQENNSETTKFITSF